MDASNPIQDSTRMSLANMRERALRLKRQDLEYINILCAGLKKLKLETLPYLEDTEMRAERVAGAVKNKIKLHKELIEENNQASHLEPSVLGKFLNTHDPFPVCKIMRDGIPLHPPTVNQAKGAVTNQLTFGGVGIDRELAALWSAHLETDELISLIESLPIYTNGTTKGLGVRLKDQLSRETVDLDIPYERFKNIMDLRMPVDSSKLLDWNADIYELAEMVQSSYNSSAGAPYWRKKQECIEDLMEVTLPMVVRALCQEGGLDDLFKKNPEMFLTSVKNKDDRYKDCTVKTRPYVSMPWHFQMLFSILSQGFCKALHTFETKGSSFNAYGFSFANGGATHLASRVLNLANNKIFSIFYGDDAYVAVNVKGTIYLICPDFKQMDGSIDAKTVRFTLRWIRDKYKEQFGENVFWDNVISLWEEFVLDPYFIVQGNQIYKKKQRGGIMSGVVGTTLFDTVKSVCAYQALFDLYEQAPSNLLNADLMIKFFKSHGLVIKEGTWDPKIVREPPVGGTLTELQFLGMQLQRMEFNGADIYVPVNPLEQWLNLALAPKRTELPKGAYQRARYLFDRLRGSLTSGGVFNDTFRKLCNSTLSSLPPAAIAMDVMAGQGKGAVPELVHTVGEDFLYSSSMGWPTLSWALNLYAPDTLKVAGWEFMDDYFDDPNGILKRPKKRTLLPQAIIADVKVGGTVVSSSVIAVDPPERTPVVEDLTPLLPLAPKVELSKEIKPNPESKIINFKPLTGEVDESQKHIPTIEDMILKLIGPVSVERPSDIKTGLDHVTLECGKKSKEELALILQNEKQEILDQILLGMLLDGVEVTEVDKWAFCFTCMWPLHQLASRLGVSEGVATYHARRLGYYVFGSRSLSFVSPVPIAPIAEPYRDQIKFQEIENAQNFVNVKTDLKNKPIGEGTQKLVKQSKQIKEVLDRAEERPAMLPPPRETILNKGISEDFRFNLIPGFNARAALTASRKEVFRAVRTVFGATELRYVEESDERFLYFYIVTTNKEKHLLLKSDASRKEAYYQFYKKVLNKYIKDVELEEQLRLQNYKTEDWSVLAEAEDQVKITLFKEHGRPILAQMVNRPIVLVAEHEKLKKPDVGPGFVIEENGNRQLVLFKRTMTQFLKVQRLNQLLGTEVETEQLSYHDFISKFPELDTAVGASARLQSISNKIRKNHKNLPKQKKNGGKEKSAERSPGDSKDRGPKASEGAKEKEPEPKPGPSKEKEPTTESKVVHGQSKYEESDSERVRLPRFSKFRHPRQSWGNQSHNQYVPYGMGWYPSPGRGQIMAEVPPPQFGGGNFYFRQQNDGWPIYPGMGGGPRRNNGYSRRRGPKQIHESKPFKGGPNKQQY